ncbi:catalytic protein, partial [Metarhizium majus ARSEF 297]
MKKTLLLCFIHGFKGGESTFGDDYEFTKHLRDIVAQKLPKVDVRVLVYPKYETRGDLGECVSRFRNWLEDKVIDMEVASGTASPTVDPSVRTILVGHSMGGIVAAELLIALASERPIYSEDGIRKSDDDDGGRPAFNALMFPYVQGVLAFDTPYLGISPGVVAHGAESHYGTAASTISQMGGLRTALWGAGNTTTKAPPAAPPSAWQKWGKVAMYAGAAGAVAAGGAAAWMNRDQIAEGWTWASSHLEFVGCLARAEELKKRVAFVVRLHEELGVGYANLYTRLGKGASSKKISMAGTVLGKDRTFCNLPKTMNAGDWMEAVNDKAGDETVAHMTMFEPKENPGYEKLSHDAAGLIAQWSRNDWYENSTETTTEEKVESVEVDEKGKGAEKEEEKENTEKIAPSS